MNLLKECTSNAEVKYFIGQNSKEKYEQVCIEIK